MGNSTHSFTELNAWQEAKKLVLMIYEVTREFPDEERFGLVSQLRRAAVSVISNIAEGQGRETIKDFINFLVIARGSLSEIEAQIIISRELGYVNEFDFESINSQRIISMKLLCRLISALKSRL